ncbi:hypothetical protein [Spiroplasma taiwanense]|uniref:Uncharacterized protein n=1 Tax=Spiroplasma taiwanense CT-1 TaxID=1276220 RepID=S5LW98_9MOLU|nr:hypothetical protein [Spiroplasma taiwanense]AGR40886.1 hypothetical protein STAIW_v1c02090 [Spiroplasma taiwanense CT-1]
MELKEYENYSFMPYEMISKEIFILYSLFGDENKYLQSIQQDWFSKKDIHEFRKFIEESFEKNEIQAKTEVNRDSLSCLLRMMAMCDAFTDFEEIYNISYNLFVEKNKELLENLKLYDYAFKKYFDFLLGIFKEELEETLIPVKYKIVVEDIQKSILRLEELNEFNFIIKENYRLNDLISDLLDLLEETNDEVQEFETDNEVILYNFSIYYSTKFYFTLLFREKILLQIEKETNVIIENNKPLIEEEEMRLSETTLSSEQSKEIFYKILKN